MVARDQIGVGRIGIERAREGIALAVGAAERGERLREIERLDAFGGGLHAQRLGETQDRPHDRHLIAIRERSEEHTSELQSLMRISYAVFCLKKKTQQHTK